MSETRTLKEMLEQYGPPLVPGVPRTTEQIIARRLPEAIVHRAADVADAEEAERDADEKAFMALGAQRNAEGLLDEARAEVERLRKEAHAQNCGCGPGGWTKHPDPRCLALREGK